MEETLIKICGITNLEDALCAAEAGADAIGFVFASSARRVSPPRAREITRKLPPQLAAVGLFVNTPIEMILDSVEASGVKAVQLHGDEPPEFVGELASRFRFAEPASSASAGCRAGVPSPAARSWPLLTKAFRPREKRDLEQLKDYGAVQAFLIDAHVEGIAGGTGKCVDWALAAAAKECGKPIILAGGLNPDNVAEAIAVVRPFAVDVSSGVESAPGKKDAAKIAEFVHRVRTL